MALVGGFIRLLYALEAGLRFRITHTATGAPDRSSMFPVSLSARMPVLAPWEHRVQPILVARAADDARGKSKRLGKCFGV
jgi:hypothetical protein